MVWSLELIDESNKTGTLEFNIQSRDPDAFFPIQVSFVSQDVYCAQVAGVSHTGRVRRSRTQSRSRSWLTTSGSSERAAARSSRRRATGRVPRGPLT